MPSEVVFTSRVAPSSIAERSSHRSIMICRPSRGVKARPSDVAAAWVRLIRRSSGTPASTRLQTTARAAPPGAQHHDRARRGAPRGRAFLQGGEEAESVAVAALEAAVGPA
jgi:hypothetical protein